MDSEECKKPWPKINANLDLSSLPQPALEEKESATDA